MVSSCQQVQAAGRPDLRSHTSLGVSTRPISVRSARKLVEWGKQVTLRGVGASSSQPKAQVEQKGWSG